MTFVGRRRTRDSLDSRIRPRMSSTLSQLFSKARRISVEPPSPVTSDGTPFHQWLARCTTDTVTVSPTPSFEIRRPSGLGPRFNSFGSVSSLGSIHRAVVVDVSCTRPGHHRRLSASEPDLLHAQPTPPLAGPTPESQTPSVCDTWTETASMLYTPSYTHTSTFPSQIWETVTQFLSHQDLSSLARVSSDMLPHARKALYENIDLGSLFPYPMRLCVESLASHAGLALLVRTFNSYTLPSFNDQQGPLHSLSFAFALCNMKNLTTLSLPRFDNDIFHYTTFRLKHLSLSCGAMSVPEQERFFSWLAIQNDLIFLSLPALTTELKHPPCIPFQRPSESSCMRLGQLSLPASLSRLTSMPNLRKFDGPISLVPDFIPGRPVSDVVLHVDKTLYDGLRPSQLMGFIAKSTASIERLSIRPSPSATIDARTMERLLMSAGAKFGPSVLHLEIGWATDDETLYQHMLSIIPRFSNLQTLNCVPASASSEAATFATVDQDLLTSPITPPPYLLSFPQKYFPETTPTPHLLSFPLPTLSDSGASDAARARERQFIKSWAKACPSLTTVTFLCGAEWCVIRRRRRVSMKGVRPAGLTDDPPMCVPSFVRWRHT